MNENSNGFLVVPTGVLYENMQASLIIKTDIRGESILLDDSLKIERGFQKDAFLPHSLIYYYREDIKCIISVLDPAVFGASMHPNGLLMLSSAAAELGKVSRHVPKGLFGDSDEWEKLACESFAKDSKVILVANFGAFCCGETIEEATFLLRRLRQAAKFQSHCFSNVNELSEEQQKDAFERSRIQDFMENGTEVKYTF